MRHFASIATAIRAFSCAVALVACVGAPALAGVTGTHHDFALFGSEEGAVCGLCHSTYATLDDSQFFDASQVGVAGLGPVGQICFSCHDGTVRVEARVEALNGAIGLDALLGGHGAATERLAEKTGGLEGQGNLDQSGLVSAKGGGRLLDCTACHDPHAGQNPPFLRYPLDELCQKCHSGSDQAGKGRWTLVSDTGPLNGAHPIGMPVRESGLDKVRKAKSEQSFRDPAAVYRVPAYTREELGRPETHWEMGGHLFGPEGKVSCPTCHSAHLPTPHQLVSEAAEQPIRTACTGCHGVEGKPENPGATPHFHPVFETSGPPYVHDHAAHGDVGNPNIPASGVIDLFVTIPSGWPLGGSGELLCSTCHVVHQGRSGSRCVRRASAYDPAPQCGLCHGAGNASSARNWHHSVKNLRFTRAERPDLNVFPSWAKGPGLPGDLEDGLQCVDCHSDLAPSAHNW